MYNVVTGFNRTNEFIHYLNLKFLNPTYNFAVEQKNHRFGSCDSLHTSRTPTFSFTYLHLQLIFNIQIRINLTIKFDFNGLSLRDSSGTAARGAAAMQLVHVATKFTAENVLLVAKVASCQEIDIVHQCRMELLTKNR